MTAETLRYGSDHLAGQSKDFAKAKDRKMLLLSNRRRMNPLQSIAIALVFSGFSASGFVNAGEPVTFSTPPIQPSAFKVKRAKAQGKTLEPTPGTPLSGVLSMPKGDGPHPAIVLLPESVEARASYDAWARYLTKNGFVTLVVDSLTSRGAELLRDDLPMDLQQDAQGAHVYLSGLADVDPKRISLMGFGLSGNFVQRSLDATFDRGGAQASFNAGVALYPNCDPRMPMKAPLLILAGSRDEKMSISTCQAMVDYNASGPAPITMKVYQNATHFFDNNDYSRDASGRRDNWSKPMMFEENRYDAKAHGDAKRAVVEFLK